MTKKKVLITGASRGLGLAMAKRLSADYELVLHATREESFGDDCPAGHRICADLSDSAQINEFCKTLKKEHGDSLYAVINNAGITFDKPLIYQPEREIDAMFNVNLKAPIMICKMVMKLFSMKKEGVIINMSSVVGQTGNAFQAVYSATKAGLATLSRSLAQEAAVVGDGHSIRVLSIAPGFIETDMTEKIPAAEKEKYLNMIPAKRYGNTNDVAETVAFLLSDKASYINATTIHINGGLF